MAFGTSWRGAAHPFQLYPPLRILTAFGDASIIVRGRNAFSHGKAGCRGKRGVCMRLFIAEDELLIQQGYRAMLGGKDYEVVGTATDGLEAVEKISRMYEEIDLVIVDINIPSIDGIEVIERVQKFKKLPCIIVTGYCDEMLIKRANKAGVYGYLQKPIDRYDLISAISVAMERFLEFNRLKNESDAARKALEERKLVERAKGILMDKFEIKEKDAMKFLQKKSRDQNKKLVEVAKSVIQAEQFLDL